MKRNLKTKGQSKKKGKSKKTKGQFNVEFFTVLILFIGFAVYFSMRLMEVRPAYIKEVKQSITRSESYRISEMLINDPGNPLDWDIAGEITRIGFLDHSQNKTNLLSEQKISRLNTLCAGGTGYNTIKSLIGAEHDFSIIVIDKTGGFGVIECSAPEFGENAASIKRVVSFDSGNYGELVVQVWW